MCFFFVWKHRKEGGGFLLVFFYGTDFEGEAGVKIILKTHILP